MRVILLQEVKGTGIRGDIKDVPSGYAINYLFKNNLAAPASEAKISQMKRKKERLENKSSKRENDCLKAVKKLGNKAIILKKKANEEGVLYGSVTAEHIAEALNAQIKANCDLACILLNDPIKKIGKHTASVCTKDKSTSLSFNIEILSAK